MVNEAMLSDSLRTTFTVPRYTPDAALPASITKAASKQTYYTIRYLVDRSRTLNAYRAYAYFRWVDDWLDQELSDRTERLAFVARQQALIDCARRGDRVCARTAEEQLLIDLIGSEGSEHNGLHMYIEHMMAVMAFDADRRGKLVTGDQLAEYSLHLSTAVTEALHYYIGHDSYSPHDETRYLAVIAAHITHMLRDTCEDVAAGYYNIPVEYLEANHITAWDIDAPAYRAWVKNRVDLARTYFREGKRYLARVGSLRCRAAGFAYTVRFETVLDIIEREDYLLRAAYPERKSLRAGLRMGLSTLALCLANIA